MASTLPLNIPIPQSAAIASFNYTDIAEGTGVVKFYGATNYTNGTTTYMLTTNTPYSNSIITSGNSASDIPAATLNRVILPSYDIKFNRSQNLKGTAYVNIPFGGTTTAAGDADTKLWVSGLSLQISGLSTVETITTVVSGNILSLNKAQGSYSVVQMISLPISGTAHAAAGETLRLYGELWGLGGAAAAIHYVGWGNDPQNRSDPDAGVKSKATLSGLSTSKLELYVPFLLNTV